MSNYQTPDREGHGLGYTMPQLEQALYERTARVADLERQVEVAESVAQMAAHDRDEALENFARVEQEYERLQQAARSILWMAREYAEGGGRGGPEMQDYEAAAEIIGYEYEPEPRAALADEQPW